MAVIEQHEHYDLWDAGDRILVKGYPGIWQFVYRRVNTETGQGWIYAEREDTGSVQVFDETKAVLADFDATCWRNGKRIESSRRGS